MKNVSYIDFWPGFDVNCNWFNLLLKNTFKDEIFNFQSTPENADIIFFSCFSSQHQQYKNSNAIKILYLGENIRPDYSVADYSFSYDVPSYNGKNCRLPHWYLYINWWDEPNFPHANISMKQLYSKFEPEDVFNRKEFCAIVLGNPVQNRIDTAIKLNEFKPVHGYGKAFDNPYDGDKVKLLENYRWNICFENGLYEGYITEKVLHAKIAGCVPIYFGDKSVSCDFNENSLLNILDYNSLDSLCEKIKYYEMNKEKFLDLLMEPLFNTFPTLDNIQNFLKEKLK